MRLFSKAVRYMASSVRARTKDDFRLTDSSWRRQIFRYHPEFGWWHVPNIKANIPLGRTFHTVRTNSLGMRSDREYPLERQPSRKRIVALGDSYLAGDGVSNGVRATDLLEARHPSLDILNFGLNGSGTDQQLLIFEKLASRFEVDAYIWFFCVENIGRNTYQCFPSYNFKEHLVVYRPKPYFDLNEQQLTLHHVPVPRERRTPDALGEWRYGFPYRHEHPDDPYAIYRDEEGYPWQLMQALIKRFLAEANSKTPAAPIFLIPLPMDVHYLQQCPPSYWPRFQSLAAPERKIHVVDVLPALTQEPIWLRYNYRFDGDPHYTHRAHAILADTVEYAIRHLEPQLLEVATDRPQ